VTGGSIAALFGTMLVLSMAPGPSDFAVIARSIASGFGHGLLMIGGIVAADFLFILLAVYSLAAVAEAMGTLFTLLQYFGGAYLLWLGASAVRAHPKYEDVEDAPAHSRFSSFIGGLLITLGDPKAILFYMGLFPAFVDLADIAISDTVIIMSIATGVIVSVKASFAFAADRARRLFENARLKRRLDIAAGVVLISTGLFVLARNWWPVAAA
jgi:threonine/homoserine/homoserine lactone efflux protein